MFSLIPLPYKIIGIVVSFLLLVGGTFYYGYHKGSQKAEKEIASYAAKANAKIADLEKKNNEINNNVITQYIDRYKVLKEKEYVYINQAKDVVPSKSNVSNGWVYLHDASAQGIPSDSARAADATASTVADNTALETVVKNYSICRQNADQLAELQKWVVDTVESIKKSNSSKE
jgi:hypothetical protein